MADGEVMLTKPFQSSLGCFHPGKVSSLFFIVVF